MKKTSIFCFICSLILTMCTLHTRAQEIVYTSIIVDSATFEPIPGASILIKNKGKGTITDEKGAFTITATIQDTLVISSLSYRTQEYPLLFWEPGIIRLTELETLLKTITVQTKAINPYEGLFDDQNAIIAARENRFYYSKDKKEKRKLQWQKQDNEQVKTYVEVVIEKPDLKLWLMKTHHLTEDQYYQVLANFNEKNRQVMYYLTEGELVTLIKNFFRLSVRDLKR